jgi:hypothetical protein
MGFLIDLDLAFWAEPKKIGVTGKPTTGATIAAAIGTECPYVREVRKRRSNQITCRHADEIWDM